MGWVWTVIIGLSVGAGLLTGQGPALSASVLQGAQAGITLAVSLAGSLCLWSGVGKLMELGGIMDILQKFLQPFLHKVFPSSKADIQLAGSLSANICANFLGLGNAATPMGIRAAKRLIDPKAPHIAGDELCRLVVLNTASIQLIPTNVAAIRSGLGAASPFDILPAVWLTSLCSAGLGLAFAVFLGRICRHD